MAELAQSTAPRRRPGVELALETWLFRARWLLAPIYLGLAVALAGLTITFGFELWHELGLWLSARPGHVIMGALALIDLSLCANLVLIVMLAGYESFVSSMEIPDGERLNWMGRIDFSGMKMKVMGTVVAISAVAILRSFMQLAEGEAQSERLLAWMIGIHLMFVVSGVLLAVMDVLMAKVAGGH